MEVETEYLDQLDLANGYYGGSCARPMEATNGKNFEFIKIDCYLVFTDLSLREFLRYVHKVEDMAIQHFRTLTRPRLMYQI